MKLVHERRWPATCISSACSGGLSPYLELGSGLYEAKAGISQS